MGYYRKLVDDPWVTHGQAIDCYYDIVGDPRVTHGI